MFETIQYSLILVLIAAAIVLELKRSLMMLQQNSYRNDRYRRWISQSGDTTTFARLSSAAVFLASLLAWVPMIASGYLIAVEAVALLFTLVGKHYKKPLVFTQRAVRIYCVALAIVLAVTLVCAGLLSHGDPDRFLWTASLVMTASFFLSSVVTILANTILEPFQKLINRRYIDDARRILADMPDLNVIGVTGSYGKTSTKHYLCRILSEEFETVMTPGSFNTTLGVVRTVREYLKPYTQVFIAEMGAKQPGDIKEICDLVHPTIGVVTAVGEQHLESFKSIENVQKTKFELIDALPADGFAVINNDFEYIANRKVENVAVVRYGLKDSPDITVTASDISVSAAGTEFTMTSDGESHRFHTRLVGECNVSNLMAAITVALHLGMKPQSIARAVERIEQVEHRLNLKRLAGGIILIDDAFNSNPVGSAMALDVLHTIEGRRKIIITPGMIELGERQHDANVEFGRKIAECADMAFIVGDYNCEAITDGISQAGTTTEVLTFPTFAQAQAHLQSISREGDVVLYENDLPDTFK